MDSVTAEVLRRAHKQYPGFIIRCRDQFLDGTKGKPCGLVPEDWNGGYIEISISDYLN